MPLYSLHLSSSKEEHPTTLKLKLCCICNLRTSNSRLGLATLPLVTLSELYVKLTTVDWKKEGEGGAAWCVVALKRQYEAVLHLPRNLTDYFGLQVRTVVVDVLATENLFGRYSNLTQKQKDVFRPSLVLMTALIYVVCGQPVQR